MINVDVIPDAFVDDLVAAWEVHGASAIERFRLDHPREFILLIAAIAFEDLEKEPRHGARKVRS
jgi:hypothetical protein